MSIQRSPVDDNKFVNFEGIIPPYFPDDDDILPGTRFPGDITTELPGKRNPRLPYKPFEEEELPGEPDPSLPYRPFEEDEGDLPPNEPE